MWSCVCFETGSFFSVCSGRKRYVQTGSENSKLLMEVIEVLVALFDGPFVLSMGQINCVPVTLKQLQCSHKINITMAAALIYAWGLYHCRQKIITHVHTAGSTVVNGLPHLKVNINRSYKNVDMHNLV